MDSLEKIINTSGVPTEINEDNESVFDLDESYNDYRMRKNPNYMFVIYICIGIIGLVGNIITCIVIVVNKSMHNVTNCYLFNLAISDLLMIMFTFPTFDDYDKYSSETVCFLRGFIAEASVYISVLTITAFSIERYLAICHPFFVRALSQISRASRTIPSIWLLGCACALPMAMQVGLVHYFTGKKNGALCTIVTASAPFYLKVSTVVFFILPMLLMICLYTLMGLRLRSSGQRLKKSDGESQRTEEDARNNSTKRVLRMLVSVVAAFFLCWAPFHLQRLVTIYFEKIILDGNIELIYNVITRISAVFSYSSTMINPVLYNVMSNKFRQAFKDTFLKV